MNSPLQFTIRIRTEQEQDIDWMVKPDEITFNQALEVISRIFPDSTITAFQYDDEDGERITVRSDAELQAMFQMYFYFLSEEDKSRGLLPPFVIYPRVGKTPQNRNIHGLKIKTAKSTQAASNVPPPVQVDVQRPPESSPPKEVMNCGAITEKELDILELIGRGNGGEVRKAYHKPTNRLMAVKTIVLDVNTEVQKKILSELDILYKCHSPAIIGFYGACFVENRISMCTEFMDGGSLDKYGQVPEQVLGRITVRIVQGLLHMLSLNILHRDLKPSNVLINTAGEVKLCDFGVSRQLVASIADTYIGTNAYMAPERINAKGYGHSSELWSLGVSVFELATGQFPYTCKREHAPSMELLKIIVTQTPPRLPEGHFSPDMVDFVSRCMQKQPHDRISHQHIMSHPLIQKYNDNGSHVIAAWVKSQLPRILLLESVY